jgi:hypothetical protein
VDVISAPLAIVLVSVGTVALLAAALVARREPLPARAERAGRLSMLVPWLGSVLVVVLLVRGAIACAVFVGVVTLVHAGLTRARASSR